MLFAKSRLEKEGFSVETFGLIENDNGDIYNADAVVLPVPVSRDKVNINCQLTGRTIPIGILDGIGQNTKIFGGGKLNLYNYTDYLSLDEYAVKNNVLTAEGAIASAISSTDFPLWKSDILVIGYGRLGKILTDRLSGFCPHLTVSARKNRDFAFIEAIGADYIKTSEIKNARKHFDMVFNTVDIKLDEDTAKQLSGAYFFDLSSSGGFLGDTIQHYDIKYSKLPSVPAKTAPAAAGKIIAETVIELLR